MSIREARGPTPPALFINGNSSLGKTAVVKTILSTVLGDAHPSRYAFLDCVECHTPRLIFEHAIYQFRSAPQQKPLSACLTESADQMRATTKVPSSIGATSTGKDAKSTIVAERGTRKRKRSLAHEGVSWEKCENINEFVEWCRKICNDETGSDESTSSKKQELSRRKGQHDTRYLVLDRAERLRDTAPTLIPVLMRLQELTGRNICVILITTIVWEKFRSKTGVQRHEGLKLHRHIQAYFVEAMDKLYLREISSREWSDRTVMASSGDQNNSGQNSATVESEAFQSATGSERALMNAVDIQNTFDLPYFTKFILIASFLASYNPPKLDMRYFAKVSNQGGKMTRRAKISAAKKHGHDQLGSKLRQQLLGPKIFPIERMLAIFYSILDEEVEENVNVHTQIASLVSLRLLQRVTPMDKLDSIKCKCNVSYDMIKALAKSTKFDIDKYLYDFA
ncbi:Origin recognition complex subunit 5 [Entomortierella chlamydospora]|uniref:Origin recognition complex subunit 5 n=1 Tax=Entomortierella chlamydospora TaxID=101097 RepID=A0A9P6MXG0_9FUNG|nr:Origin recognition complex subunit 5 [Entomortierella chlamydospora]